MHTCVLATRLPKNTRVPTVAALADTTQGCEADSHHGCFWPAASRPPAGGSATNAEAMTKTLWSSLRHKGDHRSNAKHKNVEPGLTMRRLLARRAAAALGVGACE
jgi:hypothetical protein